MAEFSCGMFQHLTDSALCQFLDAMRMREIERADVYSASLFGMALCCDRCSAGCLDETRQRLVVV